MMKITLSEQERQQLEDVFKTTCDVRLRTRCQAVLMAHRGRRHRHIAELLGWILQGPTGCGLDRANWTYAELATQLYRSHGITVSASTMRAFCASYGVRPYRPTYRYLKADPAQQARARQDLQALKKRPRPEKLSC